jgi:hypothetical protein
MGTQTTNTIEIGNLTIEVIRKNIKNVHLRVYPPSGDVRISSPLRMNLDIGTSRAIARMFGIRCRPRVGSPVGTKPQPAIYRFDGFIYAQLETLPIRTKSITNLISSKSSQRYCQISC